MTTIYELQIESLQMINDEYDEYDEYDEEDEEGECGCTYNYDCDEHLDEYFNDSRRYIIKEFEPTAPNMEVIDMDSNSINDDEYDEIDRMIFENDRSLLDYYKFKLTQILKL